MKILVVEDDDGGRRALVLVLEALGHDVCWASSGEAAVHSAVTEPGLDLVILDIGLPGISGYDVARLLPRGLAVIILSGLEAEEIRHDALTMTNAIAGALLIMSKPVDLNELEDALRRLEGLKP